MCQPNDFRKLWIPPSLEKITLKNMRLSNRTECFCQNCQVSLCIWTSDYQPLRIQLFSAGQLTEQSARTRLNVSSLCSTRCIGSWLQRISPHILLVMSVAVSGQTSFPERFYWHHPHPPSGREGPDRNRRWAHCRPWWPAWTVFPPSEIRAV